MRQTYTLTLSFLFIRHHKWRFNPTPPNSLIVIWTLTICNPVQFLNQKWILLNILSCWKSYFIQIHVSIIGELSIECWFCILDSFSAEFIGFLLITWEYFWVNLFSCATSEDKGLEKCFVITFNSECKLTTREPQLNIDALFLLQQTTNSAPLQNQSSCALNKANQCLFWNVKKITCIK